MVTILNTDSELRQAMGFYLKHKEHVNIEKLTEEKFEKATEIMLKRLVELPNDLIIDTLMAAGHLERKVKQTTYMLLGLWLGVSTWMSLAYPGFNFLSWKVLLWVCLSWILLFWTVGILLSSCLNFLAPSYIVVGNPTLSSIVLCYLWWWFKFVLVILVIQTAFEWWFGIQHINGVSLIPY